MLICSKCEESFEERSQYISHMKYGHAGLTSFQCNVNSCSRDFKSFESFRKHVRNKHSNPNESRRRKIEENPSYVIAPNLAHVQNVGDTVGNEMKDTVVESFTAQFQAANDGSHDAKIQESRCLSKVDHIVLLAARLHDFSDIPRSRIEQIINITHDLMAEFSSEVEPKIKNSVLNAKEKISVLTDIEEVKKDFIQSLESVNSEHKCFKVFKQQQTFIEPIPYKIGQNKSYTRERGILCTRTVNVTAQSIPIRHVLKSFFEMPEVFDATVKYVQSIKENRLICHNFLQGDLWKNLCINDRYQLYLPLFIYFDDYEVNNPLGSHRGKAKCGAVYLSIPCLPLSYQSKLKNIFLSILFNSIDRKLFENKVTFSKVVEELKFLETTGITIELPTGIKTLFFRLGMFVADDLGMNQILGFVENFNQNKFCRYCLTNRSDISKVLTEEDGILLDEENYTENLMKNDPKQTGIKKECVLTGIGGFHPVKNISADLLHDTLEGICRYDLGNIIHYFIHGKRYFTLTEINSRISRFNYGIFMNEPPALTILQLRKMQLIMSASEMLTFVRCFSLIIGNVIPQIDEVWHLFQQMKDVVEILMSRSLHFDAYQVLRIEIAEYLRKLNRLFPGSLKPKHHHLIHYSRIMFSCGPPSKLTSFRFEAKHKEGKATARAANNRINLCKTIAIKHQLKLNYMFLNEKKSEKLLYSKSSAKNVSLKYLNSMISVEKYFPECQKHADETITTAKKVQFEENSFEIGAIFMIPGENRPGLYKVKCILLHEVEKFIIIAQLFHDIFLDEHTQAYELCSPQFSWQVLTCSQLYGCIMSHLVEVTGGNQFILKNWY